MVEVSCNSEVNWPSVRRKLSAAIVVKRYSIDVARRTAAYLARGLGYKHEFQTTLVWGDVFNGILPEGVSTYIWRKRCFEPQTSLLLTHLLKAGDTFIDVGAHFGYFSILGSRIVGESGQVISIEAMPTTYEWLQKNIDMNNISNAKLINVAAYSKPHTLRFKDFGAAYSSLNTAFDVRGVLEGRQHSHREIDVTADALDNVLKDFDFSRISAVKIDAESSEKFVLEGMKKILSTAKPHIFMELGGAELDSDGRVSEIISSLEVFGYRLYRWDTNRLCRIEIDRKLEYDNYIFIHDTKFSDDLVRE